MATQDKIELPTTAKAKGGLYKFDSVHKRQDSAYFPPQDLGHQQPSLPLDANLPESKTPGLRYSYRKQISPTIKSNHDDSTLIIRSMSMLNRQKKRAKKKKHVRRVLDKQERHELHLKELESFMEKEDEIFHHFYLPVWKKNVLYIFESSPVELLLVLLTIFALYGSDLTDAYLAADSDPLIDMVLWLVMLIFLAENLLLARVKKGYLCSKAFNLELVAALTMLFDIKSLGLMESVESVFEGGTAARAGRAARAGTRAGRLTKLLRLFRLMRVLSLFMKLMKVQNGNSKRVTDVDLFGTEHEKEIIAEGHKSHKTKHIENKNIAPSDEEEPDDEAGAMSRRLSQTISIDAIIFLIFLLFASALVNIESQADYNQEQYGLSQLDQLARATGKSSSNMTIAATTYMTLFHDSYLEANYPGKQDCLYLQIQGVVYKDDPDTLAALRPKGEKNTIFLSDKTSAVFDKRASYKDAGHKSAWTTTVVIVVILGMIIRFKLTSDKVTKQVNTPLLNLCDDMLLVADMDLEGPIMHRPSKINEIRNAQLAFLKMKHALSSFGKYVPREVVRHMIKCGEDAEIGMERRTITIFFSDVAGFTTICEQLEPQKLLILLSEYFDAMQQIIGREDSNGTLLEFIGDALLVVWNAPQSVPEHPSICVETSIRMHEFLHDSEKTWTDRGYPLVKIRIGIHTAKVFVGNLGSPVRMKYGVLGDGVNLASRLEELNKRYNSKILMSGATFDNVKVQQQFVLRQLDQVAVKGKAQGTKIYECLGRVKDTSDDEKALVTKMNQAFHLYYDRKFVEAEATFHGVQELFQGIRGYEDAASKLLAERCSRYHAAPPGVDWNGTEVLSQKHF